MIQSDLNWNQIIQEEVDIRRKAEELVDVVEDVVVVQDLVSRGIKAKIALSIVRVAARTPYK